jgi:hypothetical protein
MELLLGAAEPMPLAERILLVVLVVVPILVLVTLAANALSGSDA